MSNPKGSDGAPMERHHIARQEGDTILIDRTTHRIIHQQERDAVRDVFEKDGLKGNPGSWTAKKIKGW